uniref:Putative transcriptional regulator n=1 Tax=Lymantria dispar multicapsid nuclear polyhedrosis virus TaxID=10449 RepID=A0A1B1MQX1_NPVLD|nr:putative transcriptional regulator [Lymantria dispar multiple nucleopolyhedrovirus]
MDPIALYCAVCRDRSKIGRDVFSHEMQFLPLVKLLPCEHELCAKCTASMKVHNKIFCPYCNKCCVRVRLYCLHAKNIVSLDAYVDKIVKWNTGVLNDIDAVVQCLFKQSVFAASEPPTLLWHFNGRPQSDSALLNIVATENQLKLSDKTKKINALTFANNRLSVRIEELERITKDLSDNVAMKQEQLERCSKSIKSRDDTIQRRNKLVAGLNSKIAMLEERLRSRNNEPRLQARFRRNCRPPYAYLKN